MVNAKTIELVEPGADDLKGIGLTPGDWHKATPEQREGIIGGIAQSKADKEQWERQAEDRKAKGRYTLGEVAEIFEGEGAGRKDEALESLALAATSDELHVYRPGSDFRYTYSPERKAPGQVNEFHEEAKWDELNAWLDARAASLLLKSHAPRIGFRFPDPNEARSETLAIADSKPMPRHRVQELATLQKIVALGYDPKALPAGVNGRRGVKSEVRAALGNKDMWTGTSVFNQAWQRLRNDGQINEVKLTDPTPSN
jgi:hypothetical protein